MAKITYPKSPTTYTVIAWIDPDGELVPTGEWERFDGYNYRPKMATTPKACAVVWRKGKHLADAQARAQEIGGPTAKAYLVNSSDPLSLAKRLILNGVEA